MFTRWTRERQDGREAGLVVAERKGMTVTYQVSDPLVFDLVDRLKQLGPSLEGERSRASQPVMLWPRDIRGRSTRRCNCPRCCGRE
jgi:hypothetical protein